ncbi:MAG: SDR family oxidoreductase [Myxococcota bacterium]
MRDPEAVAAAFDAVTEQLALPDVLVNNAAGNFPVPAEDMSPNAWRTVTDIVLNGTFYCSREFGRRHRRRLLRQHHQHRRRLRLERRPGLRPLLRHAKAGVKNMTETLAVEWGPYGIQVNGLVPGLFPHDDETAFIHRARPSQERGTPLSGSSRRPAPSSAGPRPSSRRPSRASSRAIRSSSTARTGSAARC